MSRKTRTLKLLIKPDNLIVTKSLTVMAVFESLASSFRNVLQQVKSTTTNINRRHTYTMNHANQRHSCIQQFSCGHEYPIQICEEVRAKLPRISNQRQLGVKAAKKTFFKNSRRISGTLSPSEEIRYLQVQGLCQICQVKDDMVRKTSLEASCMDLSDVLKKKFVRAKTALSAGKHRFRCVRCTNEGETLPRATAINNGLCCDKGCDEWREVEELASTGKSTDPIFFGLSIPLRPDDHETNFAQDFHGNEVLDADNASGTPQAVGHSQVQRPLSSEEIKASRTTLWPSVEATPKFRDTWQGMHYIDAGIDEDRWKSHPQTHHGRYPVAGPAPDKPLPPIPPAARNGIEQTTPAQSQARTASGVPCHQRQSSSNDVAAQAMPTHQIATHQQIQLSSASSSISQSNCESQRVLRHTNGLEWRDSKELAHRSSLQGMTDMITARLSSMSTHSPASTIEISQSPYGVEKFAESATVRPLVIKKTGSLSSSPPKAASARVVGAHAQVGQLTRKALTEVVSGSQNSLSSLSDDTSIYFEPLRARRQMKSESEIW